MSFYQMLCGDGPYGLVLQPELCRLASRDICRSAALFQGPKEAIVADFALAPPKLTRVLKLLPSLPEPGDNES
jgi:hypothetical protein